MWSVVGMFSFVAFVVLIILGLVSLVRKTGKSKRMFLSAIACLVLLIIAASAATTVTTEEKASKDEVSTVKAGEDDKQKVDQEAKDNTDAKAKSENKEEQQAVSDFEKEFYAIEKESSPIFDSYKKSLLGLSDGSSDMLTAYNATEQAKDEADSLMYRFEGVKIPDVSKDIKKLLDGAKSDIKMAYSYKKDSYKSMLSYLDEQKVSDMSKSQEYMGMADQYTLSGLAKIIEAKSKVGLEITSDKK